MSYSLSYEVNAPSQLLTEDGSVFGAPPSTTPAVPTIDQIALPLPGEGYQVLRVGHDTDGYYIPRDEFEIAYPAPSTTVAPPEPEPTPVTIALDDGEVAVFNPVLEAGHLVLQASDLAYLFPPPPIKPPMPEFARSYDWLSQPTYAQETHMLLGLFYTYGVTSGSPKGVQIAPFEPGRHKWVGTAHYLNGKLVDPARFPECFKAACIIETSCR